MFEKKSCQILSKSEIFSKHGFFQKSILFPFESEFYMLLAFSEVCIIWFAQNFQNFNFLAIEFLAINNFILGPLVTKLVIKGNCFGYLWTAKDQNL